MRLKEKYIEGYEINKHIYKKISHYLRPQDSQDEHRSQDSRTSTSTCTSRSDSYITPQEDQARPQRTRLRRVTDKIKVRKTSSILWVLDLQLHRPHRLRFPLPPSVGVSWTHNSTPEGHCTTSFSRTSRCFAHCTLLTFNNKIYSTFITLTFNIILTMLRFIILTVHIWTPSVGPLQHLPTCNNQDPLHQSSLSQST